MSFRQVRQFAPFEGIGVGGKATAKIPASGTIYSMIFRATASGALITRSQMESDFDDVSVIVDGQTYIEATGEFLLDLTEYYYESRGFDNIDGQMVIPLSRDYMVSTEQGDVYAWGTADINTITVEISLDSSSITLDAIEVYLEKTDQLQNLGDHVRLNRYPQNHGSASEDSVSDLPREPQANVLAYHIHYDDTSSKELDEVKLTIGGSDLLNLTSDIRRAIQEKAGRTIKDDASGNSTFTLDFGLTNDIRQGLPMVNARGVPLSDLRVRPTFSGAAPDQYDIFREAHFSGKNT